MKQLQKIFSIIALALVAQLVQAELTIEITQGNDRAVPIAVSPFSWKGKTVLPEDPSAIIDNDLMLSGMFTPVARKNMLAFPPTVEDVHYPNWSILKASYLVTGQVVQKDRTYTITFQLHDVARKTVVATGGFSGIESQLRGMAHRVSDRIYEKIVGAQGDFSTRILYVTAQRHSVDRTDYQLNYADADGKRNRQIISSREPILSPSWSPDGTKVTYVSFESGRPAIYLQELATGKREKLTSYRGLNNSPVWSPDGSAIAMVLSKDGSPDVYVLDLATRNLSRITSHYSIDTEPDWMPDGKSLIFTSSRGGSAQIYQQDVSRSNNGRYTPQGNPRRLTFQGRFNARAKVFPDGKSLALVHKGEGAADFNIAVLDLDTRRLRLLTSAQLEDSPSIAPGGRRLIYAVQGGKNGELGIVTADGRVKYRLPSAVGDVREPVWGPRVDLR